MDKKKLKEKVERFMITAPVYLLEGTLLLALLAMFLFAFGLVIKALGGLV